MLKRIPRVPPSTLTNETQLKQRQKKRKLIWKWKWMEKVRWERGE